MRPHCTNADARRMLRAAMLASLAALLLPCVAAAEARLAGTWSGSHGCGSTGGIPFSLTLDDAGPGLVEGELRYDAPQAPGGTGAYRVRGRVNARDGTFVLVPAEWIDRPAGHTAVGLSGTLHDNGLTIEGDLRGCTAIGSRRFTAQRGGAGAPPATAGVLADEPLVPPTGGRFEGRWKGVVQCARPPELPLALTVLEDSGALAAVVTVGWPSGSGKSLKYSDQQMVLAGQATAAAGASLQRSIMFTRALFNELTGQLDAAGQRMEGRIAGLPVSWRCETFRLERAGPPDVPVVKDAVAGIWAGYEVPGRAPADALSQVKALSLPTVMQVRIALAGGGATLHGRYDVATPLKELPERQDRYAVGIRPLLRLDDGRVVFAPMAVQRAEGQFKDERRRTFASQPYLLAIALGPAGTMTVDRLVGRITASTGPSLHRADEAERVALAAGEGPRVAFPGAIEGALAAAPSLDGQCRVLRDWAQPVTAAGNLGQMTRTTALDVSLPLFTDATFEPVFGVSYSRTSQEERTALAHFMTWICAPRLGVEALRHTAITYPLMAQRNFDDVVARTVNRQESAGWLTEAMTEIGKLPDDDQSPSRLAALEAESRRRAQELGPDGRKRVAEAIAAKREAIAVAMVRKRAAAVPSLPDTTATIPTLRTLLTDAGKVGLAPDEAARLTQAIQGKAQAIVRPAVDAARAEARQAPATLDGLAALTRTRRELGASIRALGTQLQVTEAAEAARQLDARRATLIADPSIQAAFRQAMLAVRPGGDPIEAVERTALRYVDRDHLDGGGPGRAYARAVREATDRLEIASIDFADRSTSKIPGEPSAEEMLRAIKARVDQLNDDLRSKYGRCQRREFQNDPLMAMECLTILGAGAGEQMRVRITRFEKIGCAAPAALTGFLCDYAVGIQSSSPAMQGRLGELMGGGQAARARFVHTTEGWLFRRLE